MKEPISFPGILRGEESEANWTVWATKVPSPAPQNMPLQITQLRMSRSLSQTPGINYRNVGRTISLRHHNGNWLADS